MYNISYKVKLIVKLVKNLFVIYHNFTREMKLKEKKVVFLPFIFESQINA